MSYVKSVTQQFYYFSPEERELIEKFLEKNSIRFEKNAVCGDHCRMYAEYYYIRGINGKPKKELKERLYKFLKENKVACSIYEYTLSADPEEFSKPEYSIKLKD